MVDENNYDAVTLEVVRMRLESIVDEMSSAMIRSSGSPVITEAGDFNTALFDPEGRIFAYSDYVRIHIGCAHVAVKKIIEVVDLDALKPGDAFICNDPHSSGSSHPPDVTVISPIFHGDVLAGWAQSQAHLLDVGGMTAGGFAPAADNCYGEALRFPPGIKVFDGGQPVEAIRQLIMTNVRVPTLVWNDIRSLVASNNIGARRLVAAIDELGREDFTAYGQLSFDFSEKVVRERIRSLPDGRWEGEDWTEHNGHRDEMLRIHCVLTTSGDHIELDFRGSDAQTDGFVNCSYGATLGAVGAAFIPVLAWDVPLNDGVMRTFSIRTTPGSVVDPTPPAPVSNGHLTTGAAVMRLFVKLINEVCRSAEDPVLRARTQGVWANAWTGGIASGLDDRGEFFLLFNMDGSGTGGGAQPLSDGLDCAGMVTQVGNMLPDVEMNEMFYPVLYLWKRLAVASGGHGMHRGGLGLDFAWALHGAPAATNTVFSPIAQVPADGFGGGYPSGTSGHEVWRSTNVAAALASGTHPLADLTCERRETLAINEVGVDVTADDLFRQWIAGGGGYGDPLLREPAAVERDVANGFVAREIAERVYGVVLDAAGAVDGDATTARRSSIRERRIGGTAERPVIAGRHGADACMPVRRDGTWLCAACDGEISADGSWRSAAVTADGDAHDVLAAIDTDIRAHRGEGTSIIIRERCCPRCGTLLETAVEVLTATSADAQPTA